MPTLRYHAKRSSNPAGLCDQEGTIKAFRSRFEERICEDLCRRGIDFRYERPSDRVAYIKPATNHVYNPDFVLVRPDGHTILCEAKGRLDGDAMAKHVLLKRQTDLDIRFIFQSPNARAGKTKKTCRDWADKHGFRWCHGTVPDSWLTG